MFPPCLTYTDILHTASLFSGALKRTLLHDILSMHQHGKLQRKRLEDLVDCSVLVPVKVACTVSVLPITPLRLVISFYVVPVFRVVARRVLACDCDYLALTD